MNIASLGNIFKVFQGGEPVADGRDQLFKEVLLLTLARASDVDSNIDPVETETVRRLVAQITGEEITTADVRIAAASEIYETTSLDNCLAKLRHGLSSEHRATVVQALAQVIKSDTDVTKREIDFFNSVAHALHATPAELAGLIGPGD
jgi:uncharacterized tellurite resistance protein B-like protein